MPPKSAPLLQGTLDLIVHSRAEPTNGYDLSGVRLSLLGVVLGLPLSIAAVSVIVSRFGKQVPLNMPLVGVGIALVVVAVAALASWVPARKAAVVDPLVAIRAE